MADNLRDLEGMQVVLKEFRNIGKRNREVILDILSKEHETLGDRVDDPVAEIRERYLALGGRSNATFIPAIREVREKTGMHLKDAKELVESWQ